MFSLFICKNHNDLHRNAITKSITKQTIFDSEKLIRLKLRRSCSNRILLIRNPFSVQVHFLFVSYNFYFFVSAVLGTQFTTIFFSIYINYNANCWGRQRFTATDFGWLITFVGHHRRPQKFGDIFDERRVFCDESHHKVATVGRHLQVSL